MCQEEEVRMQKETLNPGLKGEHITIRGKKVTSPKQSEIELLKEWV